MILTVCSLSTRPLVIGAKALAPDIEDNEASKILSRKKVPRKNISELIFFNLEKVASDKVFSA